MNHPTPRKVALLITGFILTCALIFCFIIGGYRYYYGRPLFGQAAKAPALNSGVYIHTEIYTHPTPEGWNGWTSYHVFKSDSTDEWGGSHWTNSNLVDIMRANGLIPQLPSTDATGLQISHEMSNGTFPIYLKSDLDSLWESIDTLQPKTLIFK